MKNSEEDNSVAEVYLQVGPDTPRLRAELDLLEQVVLNLPECTSIGLPMTPSVLHVCCKTKSHLCAAAALQRRNLLTLPPIPKDCVCVLLMWSGQVRSGFRVFRLTSGEAGLYITAT